MAEGTVVLTNADALGCVAEAAARTAEAIAAAEAAQLAADNAADAALLVVVNDALDVVIGPDGRAGLIGDTGPTGPAGADSTVAGPAGPAGADSTVAGPTGPAGANSTVAGPAGPAGADSTVAGPTGPAGADSTVAGPTGPAGADSTVAGPTGPAGADSKVAGPAGPAGADSKVAGPAGPAGADSTVAGPAGPAGADSTVAGPAGPAGADGAAGLEPVIVFTPPIAANYDYPLGQVWIDTTAYAVYILADNTPGAAVWINTAGSTPVVTYAIGDAGPAGGIVFHVTDGGLHGLEVATEDQVKTQWGCFGTPISGAKGTVVGTGEQNTVDIIAGCDETTAASVASARGRGWYLPSKDELNLLYAQKVAGVVGGFARHYYWSSSQASANNAWYQSFDNGRQDDYRYKGNLHIVRAVRAF
jgi:hypothetical protein